MEPGAAQLGAPDLGVRDVLVFRRLTDSTWAHLGGIGQGRNWAGLVDLNTATEPLLAEIPASPGGVEVFSHARPERVIGPYYARAGALVRVSNDVLVVLGNREAALADDVPANRLRELAERAETLVEDVTPARRLADELEVLHAVRAVATLAETNVRATLHHTVRVAADSLSCELGLLRDASGRFALHGQWNRSEPADTEFDAAVATLSARAGGGTLCIQDTAADDQLPVLFSAANGVRALLALPFPEPMGGLLVVAHTDAGPRGFTNLCRRLAEQVVDAATVVARTAMLREELLAQVEQNHRCARVDPLTGLGNRLCWDEALEQAQNRIDSGECVTVITIDLDGLKAVNDALGHSAGDALLQRCADILRAHSRPLDIVVRLGGDEFALLLPIHPTLARTRVAELTAALSAEISSPDTVAASVGSATAGPEQRISDAVRDADAAMYRAKQARRLRHGSATRA